MSNKTRLEAVSSALDTAINTANSLPDAGDGGVSVDTTKLCNITLSSDYLLDGYVFYGDLYGKQEVKHNVIVYYASKPVTVKNVVCGTIMYVFQTGFYSATSTDGEIINVTSGSGLAFRVPDIPTDVTINITTE